MKLTFFANACCIFESEEVRLLCDPWIVDGAYEGAWHHFPPLRTKPEDLASVDMLYISHLHPDHFDPHTLKVFPRDIPIVILARERNFLATLLRRMEFTNVVEIGDGESREMEPFELTIYEPFEVHLTHEAEIGFHIDSAIVVSDGTHTVVNTNDNRPSIRAAQALKERHGEITVAQLMYGGASPYPSCFMNLAPEEQEREAARVVQNNLKHMVAVAEILQPRFVMPFAGEFVLGGREWKKNEVLGTTSWDNAAEFARKNGFQALVLNEGLTFDLEEERITNGTYVPTDLVEQERYIREDLARLPYSFDDDSFEGVREWLVEKLPIARAQLLQKQREYNCFPNVGFYLQVGKQYFFFHWQTEECRMVEGVYGADMPWITCSLDLRILKRILERRAHWNNVELGCHMNFVRVPNTYQPDMHALLSFLHLPKE
jgi:UDP-MurNAc hydroxylase